VGVQVPLLAPETKKVMRKTAASFGVAVSVWWLFLWLLVRTVRPHVYRGHSEFSRY
jgi:hypothetical protein